MIPKWPWTLQGQKCPIYLLQVPQRPLFHSVSFYGQRFSSYRTIWDNCTKCPKMTLNSKRSKVHHMHVITTPRPNFHTVSSYGQRFSSYRSIWDMCTECPQMTLNTKRSKVPYIHVTTTLGSHVSLRFALQISHFWDIGNFSFLHWTQCYISMGFFLSLNLKFQNTKKQVLRRFVKKETKR